MGGSTLLTPLRHRDFALLCAAMTVSLLGDGILFVAIPWQIYTLTDAPTALSFFGLAWSVGLVAFLVPAGSLADRLDRRVLMIGADAVRGVLVATMAALTLTGTAEVWHLVALVGLYGIAEAFFVPAFSALIPQLVPPGELVQANALQQVLRPGTLRLAGPALGGLLVAALGPGTALLVDAGTFGLAIACVLAIRARPERVTGPLGSAHGGAREGLAWARREPWFWATLVMAALGLMVTLGPQEVLLPYVLRYDLDASPSAFGLTLAAGGVGGIVGGLAVSAQGMPARPLRFIFLWWAMSVTAIAGYALAAAVWQLVALTFVFGLGASAGMVVWSTLMQTRVPPAMLGRVSALDYVVSIGLVPVSFALTGPVAALAGTDATLLGGGLVGAALTLGIYYLVPGLRADDARSRRANPAPSRRRLISGNRS